MASVAFGVPAFCRSPVVCWWAICRLSFMGLHDDASGLRRVWQQMCGLSHLVHSSALSTSRHACHVRLRCSSGLSWCACVCVLYTCLPQPAAPGCSRLMDSKAEAGWTPFNGAGCMLATGCGGVGWTHKSVAPWAQPKGTAAAWQLGCVQVRAAVRCPSAVYVLRLSGQAWRAWSTAGRALACIEHESTGL